MTGGQLRQRLDDTTLLLFFLFLALWFALIITATEISRLKDGNSNSLFIANTTFQSRLTELPFHHRELLAEVVRCRECLLKVPSSQDQRTVNMQFRHCRLRCRHLDHFQRITRAQFITRQVEYLQQVAPPFATTKVLRAHFQFR